MSTPKRPKHEEGLPLVAEPAAPPIPSTVIGIQRGRVSVADCLASVPGTPWEVVPGLGNIIMRYLEFLELDIRCCRGTDPPSCEGVSAAQRVWAQYTSWGQRAGAAHTRPFRGMTAQPPDSPGATEQGRAVFWLSEDNGYDVHMECVGKQLTHVAIVAGCWLETLEDDFLCNLPHLEEVVFALPGVREVGCRWLARCSSLRSVRFGGMGMLHEVGGDWLAGCSSLVEVTFCGLEYLRSIGAGLLRGCARLEAADLSALVGLTDDVDPLFGRPITSAQGQGLREAEAGWVVALCGPPRPPSLRRTDGSLQVLPALRLWEDHCPSLTRVALAHYGIFVKAAGHGGWQLSEVDPAAYYWPWGPHNGGAILPSPFCS
jgi:hypothetical protein